MPHRKEIYVDVLEKASATIFVSKALLERAKSLGFSGKNAVVIPNGTHEQRSCKKRTWYTQRGL